MAALQEYPDSYFSFAPDEELIRRSDLHYFGGGSDKVYIILLIKSRLSMEFTVRKYYGRRKSNLQLTEKQYTSSPNARLDFGLAQKEKVNKGYSLVHDYTYPGNSSAQPNPTPKLHVAEAKPPVMMQKKLGRELTEDDFALEYVPTNKAWCFIQINIDSWTIYGLNRDFICSVDFEKTVDIGAINEYAGYVFYGVEYNNKYGIIDFCSGDEGSTPIYDVQNRVWKQRRAMMTQIFGDIYATHDPFDRSHKVFLNDYQYEDKMKWYQEINDGVVIARDINSGYMSATYIEVK